MIGVLFPTIVLAHVVPLVGASAIDKCTTPDAACKSIGSDTETQGNDDAAFLQTARAVALREDAAASSYLDPGPRADVCTGHGYIDLISYDTRLHVTSIPAVRNFTIRRHCAHKVASILLQKPDVKDNHWYANATVAILSMYFAISLIGFGFMLRTIVWPGANTKAWLDSTSDTRPEQEAWNRSYFHWIVMSWVDPWMGHWGNAMDPSMTTIDTSSLGHMGSANDEANTVKIKMGKLWDEQAPKNTPHDLILVIVRFIGYGRLFSMFTLLLICQTFMFVGPALLIREMVSVIEKTHSIYQSNPDALTLAAGFWPTTYAIAFCFGGGMAFIFMDSMTYQINVRTNYHVKSGLNALCFEKAQRLKGANTDFELPRVKGEPPMKYSFVSLANNDLNSALSSLFVNVFNAVCFIPIVIVLFVIMVQTIHKALVIVCVLQLILFLVVFTIAVLQAIYAKECSDIGGNRVALCTEIMQGIRLVKAYGWEAASEKLLLDLRSRELEALRYFFRWTGHAMFVGFNSPRLFGLTTLFAYVFWYGNISATQIFTLMQLLRQFTGALKEILSTFPFIAQIYPSIVRVTHFLHCPEIQTPGQCAHPTSMRPALMCSTGSLTPERKVVARVKGSFKWSRTEPPVLKNIDFEAYEGELIAIVGEVAAGKSSLLSAFLGDMTACEDAICNRPAKMAYHAQVPTICEGSLRDNIIFWREFDEQRYETVLKQACLLRDLEFLPGNDCCCIGHRGVVLSGGQKARVSLARMAYTVGSSFVLCDDPFGSVDMPTGDKLLSDLLKGDLLEGATRVVVCQPDMDRLSHFDRVLVMAKGEIVADGNPQDVQHMPCFKDLQKSLDDENQSGETRSIKKNQEKDDAARRTEPSIELREEEYQGRADYDTCRFFLQLGGTWNFIACLICFGIMTVIFLLSDVVLAQWGSAQLHHHHHPKTYLWAYGFWSAFGALWWIPTWQFGSSWALNVSGSIFHMMLAKLLRAPIDVFYDRTPVGRILNRLSSDLLAIDFSTFIRVSATFSMVFWFLIPLTYIHASLPLWFLGASVPFYFLMSVMVRRYWNLMVPLRYLTAVTRSKLGSYVNEVTSNRQTYRLYGVCDRVSYEQGLAVDASVKTEISQILTRKWLIIRFVFMYSIFLTCIVLVALWFPTSISVGTASLCLTYMISLVTEIELNLEQASAAQFEFINMNRVHEYTDLPQEREAVLANDSKYTSVFVRVKRVDLGKFQTVPLATEGHIGIVRDGKLLLQSKDGESFKLGHDQKADGGAESWKEIVNNSQDYPKLAKVDKKHRLVAIGFDEKSAESMAQTLCSGREPELTLCFQSEFLADGARLDIRQLKAGYTRYPDTLHGISFEIPAKNKTAIMGSSGCGKSTFLQCLLRIIEPRSGPGSIMINRVDTQTMGLDTLRNLLGLVPQDPVLFSGSMRMNLDPFGDHTDERLWKSLVAVGIDEALLLSLFPLQKREIIEKKYAAGLTISALGKEVEADGENFSFGQRQLLCIARMMLRQPAVLLLDECTSAIDPRTQRNVQDAIRKGFPNSTMISVAHRLETIMDFDQVVLFDRGNVKKTVNPQKFDNVQELIEWAAKNPEDAETPTAAKKLENDDVVLA